MPLEINFSKTDLELQKEVPARVSTPASQDKCFLSYRQGTLGLGAEIGGASPHILWGLSGGILHGNGFSLNWSQLVQPLDLQIRISFSSMNV